MKHYLPTTQHLRVLAMAIFLVCTTFSMSAQVPTVSSFSPTTVTQRSIVVITGTNFTGTTAVRFGGTNAASFTINSATQITAVVALGTSGAVVVQNASGSSTTGGNITYVAPVSSPTAAGQIANRIHSDFIASYGPWSSTTTTATTADQPNNAHNLTGFNYNGQLYSTGVNNALLPAGFVNGDFRALPINTIAGNTSGTASSNYYIFGSSIDGNGAASVPTAATVAGKRVREILSDGIKGLGLGTGVTNMNTSGIITFPMAAPLTSKIADAQPDIIISQVASPASTVDTYVFLDAAGNVVGSPMTVNLNSYPALGTWRTDLFTLPTSTPYNTATVNGGGEAAGTRDVRLVALKLSDFNITATNSVNIAFLRFFPGGDSDPGFMAYNAEAFLLPAPVITVQPVSQAVCPNVSQPATFSVTATGDGVLTYQWYKDGVIIAGATASTFTIPTVTSADVATYTVVVSNNAGSVTSSPAYLNIISVTSPTSVTACQNATATLTASATGANPTYQWYSNATNTNVGGTLVSGATSATFNAPTITVGTIYYYTVISANGLACTSVSTNAAGVTVSTPSVAGTISGAQTICSGSTATVTVTGNTGTIQWQQSSDNASWVSVAGGTGATSASYTTPNLTTSTYFRAAVTSGSCGTAFTASVLVTVNPASVGGTVSANQVICMNATATVSVTGAVGNIQWQQSADGVSNWINVTGGFGAQTANYTTPAVMAPTYYRAAVTSGVCPTVYSGVTMVGFSETTWNGTSWSNGIPTFSTAIIFTGAFTAVADLQGCSITVNNNAVVSIPSGFNVTIYGAITVNTGSFTLQSNANLLQQTAVTNSGNIIVKRTTIPLKRLDYVLWSTPVSGQNLFNFSPLTNTNRFYTYNPTTDLYNTIASPSTTTMQTGTGYLVRMPNNFPTTPTIYTGTFTGVPNNGTYTVPVSQGRYNAVGNPYPSTINANAFMTANNVAGALYFWRKSNDTDQTSYATYTFAGGTGTGPNTAGDPYLLIPNGIIQTGQGFLYNAASSVVTFNNSMRVANNANQFFRSASDERSRIWLNLTNTAGIFSQTMIAYMDGATSGVDMQIDGKYINDSQVALTSLIDGNEYAIQGRSLPFSTSDAVALGFKAITAGTYTIGIDHVDGLFLDANQAVYLKDNLLQTNTNLQQGAYTFATESGVFNGRFELLYDTALGVNNPTSANAVVYVQNADVIVNTGLATMSKVSLFDIRGRLLVEKTSIDASEIRIPTSIANEPVIVKITMQDGSVVSKKIVL